MKKFGLLFFLIPWNIFGQDLTGTWIGSGGSGAHYLKLVIIQKGDSCYGYTYDEGPGFCKANFAGRFDNKKQKLKGRGTGFIAKSEGHSLGVYHLNYLKNDDIEYLEGTLGPASVATSILTLGISSSAQLKKLSNAVDTTRFMRENTIAFEKKKIISDTLQSSVQKKEAPDKVKGDATVETNETLPLNRIITEKQGRVSKMVETIYTDADTIQMMLYDNGVMDNDTVTVFLDNAVILDRYPITEKAKELYIPLKKNGQSRIVELFANNLGTIPPNTALIIIMAGKERYELRASYDLSTNAKIIFQFKE